MEDPRPSPSVPAIDPSAKSILTSNAERVHQAMLDFLDQVEAVPGVDVPSIKIAKSYSRKAFSWLIQGLNRSERSGA